jgi:hypothetical protein
VTDAIIATGKPSVDEKRTIGLTLEITYGK